MVWSMTWGSSKRKQWCFGNIRHASDAWAKTESATVWEVNFWLEWPYIADIFAMQHSQHFSTLNIQSHPRLNMTSMQKRFSTATMSCKLIYIGLAQNNWISKGVNPTLHRPAVMRWLVHSAPLCLGFFNRPAMMRWLVVIVFLSFFLLYFYFFFFFFFLAFSFLYFNSSSFSSSCLRVYNKRLGCTEQRWFQAAQCRSQIVNEM